MYLLLLTQGSVQVGGKAYLRYTVETSSPYYNYVALDRMYIITRFRKGNLLVRFTTDVAPLTKLVGEGSQKSAYALYVKHAYVQWTAVDNASRNLKLQFGIVPAIWTGMEERYWGHRFVEKTTYDLYGLESTADMGVAVRYRCRILPWELHTGIYNGNGYKLLEDDPHKDVMARLSIYPTEAFGLKDLLGIHLFAHTTTEGVGFKDRYIAGLTLNHPLLTLLLSQAYYTTSYRTYSKGGAFMGVLHLLEGRLNLFGRYDLMDDSAGVSLIGGLSYRFNRNLALALSYRRIKEGTPSANLHVEAKF